MTPILVIGFGIQPLAAVSSDLVAAVVMKPIGGGIHFRRGTVHTGLVKWLALGSVPGALVGSYVVSHLSGDVGDTVKVVLGVVLLVAAGAMVVRGVPEPPPRRRRRGRRPRSACPVRRAPTFVIGLLGGAIVGMTSVGSGSLMIVALMLLYPTLSSKELVGTDLVQAVPLVLAAAIGHLVWGEFEFGLTSSLLIGAVPGVIIGAHVSSRAPDAIIRPVLVLVLALSALKLLDVPNEVLARDPRERDRRRPHDVVRQAAAEPCTRSRASRSAGGVGVARFSTRLSANTAVRTGRAAGGNHGMRYRRRA